MPRARFSSFIRLLRRGKKAIPVGESFLFVVLFVVGAIILSVHCATWVIPQWREIAALHATSAKIIATRVQEHQFDNAADIRFRPEVLLNYYVRGKLHEHWTYNAHTLTKHGGYSTQRKTAEEIIAGYHAGEEITCWVDFDHPERVVLHRFTSVWGWYFLFSVPLPLLVFGGVGLWWTLRDRHLSAEHHALRAAKKIVPDFHAINESPGTHLSLRLPTTSQPSVKLVGLTFAAVIWNTISWCVLVYTLLQPNPTWQHYVACGVFGVLFCGSGLMLLGWIIQQLLMAFSIGPTLLEISQHPIVPNRRYRLLLIQSGTMRVRRWEVAVVCVEVTRFRQGTDTLTSIKEVYHDTLAAREDFDFGGHDKSNVGNNEVAIQQEMTLKLPLGVMHSFASEHNEIVWRIVVSFQYADGSHTVRDCPIVVLPATMEDE